MGGGAGWRALSLVSGYSNQTVKKAWLSDPATYPVMAVIAGGLTLVAGIWTRKLAWDPEVTMVRGERMAEYPTTKQQGLSKFWIKQDVWCRNFMVSTSKYINPGWNFDQKILDEVRRG